MLEALGQACLGAFHVGNIAALIIVTSLYVLVAGPIGLLIGVPFKSKGILYFLGHIGVFLALGLAGIRYRVFGREHIPPGAVVFCSNHESNVDPPVLFQATRAALGQYGASDIDGTVVKVWISKIRSKFNRYGLKIENVWNTGYRLPPETPRVPGSGRWSGCACR